MKGLFKYFGLFAVVCFVFLGLNACTDSSRVDRAGKENVENSDAKKDDGFPPPPSKIANADFKLIDGETFGLKESDGQVTLINLWGVWCIPCIREMPHLIEMQEKYRDKKFQIVGLNVGDADGQSETEENIKAFKKKHELNYKLGWVDRSILEEFYELADISAVPISFLVTRNGKLTGIFVGGGPESIDKMQELVKAAVDDS